MKNMKKQQDCAHSHDQQHHDNHNDRSLTHEHGHYDHHYHHDHEDGALLEHHHSIREEIVCHLPYAIFSVALSLLVLSFLSMGDDPDVASDVAYRLFHNFHYLHILFASTGAILTFRKYSKNVLSGLLVGFLVPTLFCTLSDSIIPYLGGRLVNLDMHFHWCFISHLNVVIPFLVAGVVNGWVMSKHSSSRQLFYTLGFHFFHIFISSMASVLYLVAFGYHNWWEQMGFVFVFLIGAVLIPCTLSDIVIPMIFALVRHSKK